MNPYTPQSPLKKAWQWRTLLRFFGSIQLAMLLLAVIILACIVGTVAESRFDTTVAKAYIYDASWFYIWLFLLCVNLLGAVAVRYPWKPHQTGFILTHLGIVVLLFGAVVGRIWGVEGFVTLYENGGAVTQLVMDDTVVEVLTENGKLTKRVDLDLRPPAPASPIQWDLGEVKVSVNGYTERLGRRSTLVRQPGGRPAVHVVLTSSMVSEPVDYWLLLEDAQRSSVEFGPGRIRFISEKPDLRMAQTEGITSSGSNQVADRKSPRREKHFVFLHLPEMGMIRAMEGEPSGFHGTFGPVKKGQPGPGTLQLQRGDTLRSFPITELIGKTTPLEGTEWQLENAMYFPDFRLEGKTPVSASHEPNNPALVFEMVGPAAESMAHDHDCEHESGECDANHSCCSEGDANAKTDKSKPLLTLYRNAEGGLEFETLSKGRIRKAGPVALGESVPVEWADWALVVDEVMEEAAARMELAPLPANAKHLNAVPGVHVEVVSQNGRELAKQWISSGEFAVVKAGEKHLHVRFGPRVHPLEFAIVLDDFEVEWNEGTMNPAGFKSHVRFVDLKTKETLPRKIWMNHPANYPEFIGAGWLGTTYKFSQSSWNPDHLGQTTLQVIKDPGWSLKWIGSLIFCAGLFTLFYLKPYPRRACRNSL